MVDKVNKRRQSMGEVHGSAKLSESQVEMIRSQYVKGSREFGTVALANLYGVSKSQIWMIVMNKKWRHVT